MLLMFVIGSANIGWMLALGAVMAAEKNLPVGRRLAAPIVFAVHEGKGTLRIGDTTEATMEPFRGPGGKPTTLVDSIYSTIPGSPAYLAKASTFRMKNRAVGVDVDLRDHNAIQGQFAFEA